MIGRVLLCGVCALAFASATRGADWRGATSGFVGGMALGVAIEVVKVGLHPTVEVLHDVALVANGPGADGGNGNSANDHGGGGGGGGGGVLLERLIP